MAAAKVYTADFETLEAEAVAKVKTGTKDEKKTRPASRVATVAEVEAPALKRLRASRVEMDKMAKEHAFAREKAGGGEFGGPNAGDLGGGPNGGRGGINSRLGAEAEAKVEARASAAEAWLQRRRDWQAAEASHASLAAEARAAEKKWLAAAEAKVAMAARLEEKGLSPEAGGSAEARAYHYDTDAPSDAVEAGSEQDDSTNSWRRVYLE